ncbi:MAG: phosphoribosylaminoimidazolesuccinocarboxamide synthase, partial [Byssovorax sp.]
MVMQVDTPTPRLPAPATNLPGGTNPLAVIVVFVSLTEFIAGGALILKAEGGVLAALTTFVIAFPVSVAAAFFFVLWFRPAHLYAPKDHTSSQDFIKSLRVNSELRQREIAKQNDAYKNQLETLRHELNQKLTDGSGAQSTDIYAAVTEAVAAAEKATSISVEMPDGKKENAKFPEPIITPATKNSSGHDEDISLEDIVT